MENTNNPDNLKTTKTVFAVGTLVNDENIINAKTLLNQEYANNYTQLPPHITLSIVPIPRQNMEKAISDIEKYISKLKKTPIQLGGLEFEKESSFYLIPALGKELNKIHKKTVLMLNKFREGYIREKDAKRMAQGKFDKKEIEYLKKYGYSRVLDNFETHVTVGDVNILDVDFDILTRKLKDILKPVLNKSFELNMLHAVYFEDAKIQSDMAELWVRDFWF